ncbi:MAG: VOC family protein [Pirellulaceae bacterium]
MHFAYTIIYVTDVAESLKFYQEAFGLQTSFLHPSQQYGELTTGETKLAFASHALVSENVPISYRPVDKADSEPVGVEIGLLSNDVESDYRRAISAGATAVSEPAGKPWGQTIAYVRDLNGVLVEICSPIRPQ